MQIVVNSVLNLSFDRAGVYSYNFAGSLGVARFCGHEIRPFEPEQAPPWAGNLRREATDIYYRNIDDRFGPKRFFVLREFSIENFCNKRNKLFLKKSE